MAADCSHRPQSGIAPEHQDEESDQMLIPAVCQRLCSSRKTIGATETVIGALNCILKVCSVFTHIHFLILRQSSPPTPPPKPHTVAQAFCRKDSALFRLPAMTLRGSGCRGHQGCASAYPYKCAEVFAGPLVPSCQLLQIRRLFLAMKYGIYDFLMGTL